MVRNKSVIFSVRVLPDLVAVISFNSDQHHFVSSVYCYDTFHRRPLAFSQIAPPT